MGSAMNIQDLKAVFQHAMQASAAGVSVEVMLNIEGLGLRVSTERYQRNNTF